MKCPKCKKEIEHVNVISLCWQRGDLEGNKIVNYGSVEEIYDTEKIECSECQKDIRKHIEE